LRDLTLEQGYISAKVNLDKTELSLAKLRDTIEIDTKDAIRDVETKIKQVALAEQSRKLSEKKLEIETEKMKAGRSTNFQLVSYQNDLVNAQNNELSAVITYLNALTSLDRTLGTTLATWGITIDERIETNNNFIGMKR
jgi:outer membrane protein TolC